MKDYTDILAYVNSLPGWHQFNLVKWGEPTFVFKKFGSNSSVTALPQEERVLCDFTNHLYDGCKPLVGRFTHIPVTIGLGGDRVVRVNTRMQIDQDDLMLRLPDHNGWEIYRRSLSGEISTIGTGLSIDDAVAMVMLIGNSELSGAYLRA